MTMKASEIGNRLQAVYDLLDMRMHEGYARAQLKVIYEAMQTYDDDNVLSAIDQALLNVKTRYEAHLQSILSQSRQ